jgi:RimJ/RimL family protein N-acetyltransferase
MSTPTPAPPVSEVACPAETYEVRVAGHLDDHWAEWLGCHSIDRNEDASTTLRITRVDQAQLHGVLTRIRDLGVDLLALATVPGRPCSAPTLDRTLHTERLTLRPATEYDAEATWSYRRLDSVNEWLTGVPAGLPAYRSSFQEPSRLAATVIVERPGDSGPQVIGDFMLRLEDAWAQVEVNDRAENAQAELGWVLDPAHTGRGYATEAVRELLRYCFEQRGVHRVVANCFLDNRASWRLMEKVGMRREIHAVSESLHRSGRWLDTVGYALLAPEWKRSNAPSDPENPDRERS